LVATGRTVGLIMLSLHDLHKARDMSLDEAMLTSRHRAQYRTRDGTVLPPTLTSRRFRQATMSVVDMSRAMDVDYMGGLAVARHQRCYDDQTSTNHRAKRMRRRCRHDNDDVTMMDTVDYTESPVDPSRTDRPAHRCGEIFNFDILTRFLKY